MQGLQILIPCLRPTNEEPVVTQYGSPPVEIFMSSLGRSTANIGDKKSQPSIIFHDEWELLRLAKITLMPE